MKKQVKDAAFDKQTKKQTLSIVLNE